MNRTHIFYLIFHFDLANRARYFHLLVLLAKLISLSINCGAFVHISYAMPLFQYYTSALCAYAIPFRHVPGKRMMLLFVGSFLF